LLAAARSIIRGLLPGVESSDLRIRIVVILFL
jgi:hypothetical protein